MHREQRLIRCHHMFARSNRRLHQVARGTFRTTDAFHHHIHLRIGGECHGVVIPAQPGKADATVAVTIPRGYGGDGNRPARARGNDIRIGAQQFHHTGANRSKAGNRNR